MRCLPTYDVHDSACATNPNGNWSCTNCLSDLFPFFHIEENENIIPEINNNTRHTINLKALNVLVFQPFEINELEETNDLDPDENYFSPTLNQSFTGCTYLNFDQLNQEINKQKHNQLSIFSLNIRSLQKNHRGLITLLDIIDTQFHIIALSET